MGKRIVTSIRLEEELARNALALGLNVSRISEEAVRRALMKLQPQVLDIIPRGVTGVTAGSRVLMDDARKFENIKDLKIGDKVVSFDQQTETCEVANVIDVGPLTSEATFVESIRIVNNCGSEIELLPDTTVRCWEKTGHDADWVRAEDIQPGHRISLQSWAYRKGSQGLGGSTFIVTVDKKIAEATFYKLEVYPNNCFFTNSNIIRKLHYADDALGAAWGFPVKGYLGQIGTLLEGP